MVTNAELLDARKSYCSSLNIKTGQYGEQECKALVDICLQRLHDEGASESSDVVTVLRSLPAWRAAEFCNTVVFAEYELEDSNLKSMVYAQHGDEQELYKALRGE